MSADPTAAPQPTISANDLEARIKELAAKYPIPGEQDGRAWIVDRRWLDEQLTNGAFDAYYGKVLAVYNKELIGAGDNYYEMLLVLSPKYNVHPERIVCVYLGDEWDGTAPANPPVEPKQRPSPKVRAQLTEIRELEKQFSLPTWDDVRPDWEWFHAHSADPEMEPYYYQLVAIYNKQVVGSDPQDELALRIRLSKQYRVHPERFVISFNG